MTQPYTISRATHAEFSQIDQLLRAAFEGPDEAGLVTRLRTLPTKRIELVATQDGNAIGHILLTLLEAPKDWGALAPLSVAESFRQKGVGAALVHAAIEQASKDEWPAIVVLGDPKYYGRFGFDTAKATEFSSPYPIQFTGILELSSQENVAQKTITYPSEFEGV